MTTDPLIVHRPHEAPHDPDRPLPQPAPPEASRSTAKRRHYTPFLLLRADVTDSGARPLPGGAVFWESPDVWTVGSRGVNQPVAGEPTQVFARLSNLGLADATGVRVNFWWANPSLAITEQNAHLIATAGTAVLSHDAAVFRSPVDWVPTLENAGHECLVVEAGIPAFDPLTEPMQPATDRHVGQKNECVLEVPAGHEFELRLDAFNFTIERQQLVMEARRTALPRDFERRFSRPRGWDMSLKDATPSWVPALEVAKACHCERPGSRAGAARVFALAAGEGAVRSPCLGPALVEQAQAFGPGEMRHVRVAGTLPRAAVPGEVHALRFTQRIGTVVTGGYTVFVVTAPR